MSIVVGEVIAVTGIKISLRIFEDSSHETIFYDGVKYRGVSLREHISIQRGFIDIVCLVEGEFLDERKVDADYEKNFYIRKVDVRPIGFIVDGIFNEGVKYMPMIRDKASLLSERMIGKIYGTVGTSNFSIGTMLKETFQLTCHGQRYLIATWEFLVTPGAVSPTPCLSSTPLCSMKSLKLSN